MWFRGLRVVVGLLSLLLLPNLCFAGFSTDDLEISGDVSLIGDLTISDNMTVSSDGVGSTTYIRIWINGQAYILTAKRE